MDYIWLYEIHIPVLCQVHPILSKSIHQKNTSLGLCHSHHLSLLHCLSTWFLGAQREGFEVYPLVILTPGNGKIQETKPLCKGWSEIQWRGLLEKKSKLRPFWGALIRFDTKPEVHSGLLKTCPRKLADYLEFTEKVLCHSLLSGFRSSLANEFMMKFIWRIVP